MGAIIEKTLPHEEQFPFVNDNKLRATLAVIADKFSGDVRNHILQVYSDSELLGMYHYIREAGIYETGGKSKTHRKIMVIPDGFIYNFLEAVMVPMYGKDWKSNRKALQHDLVKPWLTVKTF